MKVLMYFCQSQNVTREKLYEALPYEKAAPKMFAKWTPGASNFERCLKKNIFNSRVSFFSFTLEISESNICNKIK